MSKIKLLSNNKKSQFMIYSMIIFSVIIILFSLLMFFSPAISKENIDQINNLFTNPDNIAEKYSNFLGLFLINANGEFVFKTSLVLIVWIPFTIGLIGLVLFGSRLIIHLIGYNVQTKNGVARIVRPIRSYQLTMIFGWVWLVLLSFVVVISYFSASPFLIGTTWKFNFTGVPVISKESYDIIEILKGQFVDVYWLTFALFSEIKEGIINEESTAFKWLWVLTPVMIQAIVLFVSFASVICGECSWWSINLKVLKIIDLQVGTHLANEYTKVEKPVIKIEKDKKEIKEQEIKTKKIKEKHSNKRLEAILYYKKLIKLLEQSGNTNSVLYNNALEKLKLFSTDKELDWDEIMKQIDIEINDFTLIDKKFVELIYQLMTNPRINLFGKYKNDLKELIKGYNDAIITRDLFEAEIKLEQIFAISFRKEELLAKVGFCLKNRVSTNFKYIDQKSNVIQRLNDARNYDDLEEYRSICFEIISEMSPIKPIISNYMEKIIYN